MGLNIAGIAINSNFNKNVDELIKKLDWSIEFDKEIVFEEASSNWKDDKLADIYFTNSGTIIFLSEPFLVNEENTKGLEVLGFGLSETVMAFVLNYYKDGTTVREKITHEGNLMTERGEKLEIEGIEEDISEQIHGLINHLIGVKFWDIDLGEKAFRYKFVPKQQDDSHEQKVKEFLAEEAKNEKKYITKKELKTLQKEIKKIEKAEAETKGTSTRKWWQFWR